MSPQKMVYLLMAVVAVVILGIAGYTFTHFSTLDMTQGLIMIAVGIIGVFIVMGIIILLIKNANLKK